MVLLMSSMHISTELLHLSMSSSSSTRSLDHLTHMKHKRHRTENGNDSGKVVGNSFQSVDINKELSLWHVKFDQFKRQQSGSGNADGENFSQQEEEENVDGGEMHKKKKKKKQEVESLHNIDSTVKFGVREADGKHVSFRIPRIEKCSSMLDNLVGSLDLPKSKIFWWLNFRLKDLPSFIRTIDPNDFMLEYLIEVAARVRSASAIVFDTFDELERNAMNGLSSMLPFLCTIGLFPLLLNQSPQNNFASLGSNLWKEDPKCLEWLESKESESVVYVNFGSITVMSAEQLLEFAWGLANSKKPFLWIIRPDLLIGGSVILSSEFVNETKDRSLIANQPTNCRYIYNEWEIGIEIDTNVKREEVEKLVNDLMVGGELREQRSRSYDNTLVVNQGEKWKGFFLGLEKDPSQFTVLAMVK
ncbi:7-deoxyloganetin glucosyltransferase [Glycine max]|nr:7-deoxyloganetin glucosyltransferase [Glycine max]